MNSYARGIGFSLKGRGNGAGSVTKRFDPSYNLSWGGRPNGPGHVFQPGHKMAINWPAQALKNIERDTKRADDIKDMMHGIATDVNEPSMTRVRAGQAWLDRFEGTPVARNLNVNVNEVSGLTDEELNAELGRHRAVASLAAGAGEDGDTIEGETPEELPE